MEQLIFLSENLRVSAGLFKCKRVDSSPVATNVEQNVTINRRELPTYENKKKISKVSQNLLEPHHQDQAPWQSL